MLLSEPVTEVASPKTPVVRGPSAVAKPPVLTPQAPTTPFSTPSATPAPALTPFATPVASPPTKVAVVKHGRAEDDIAAGDAGRVKRTPSQVCLK